MTDEQMAKVKEGVQLLPMTAGTIVLAYNLSGNPKGLKLSRAVYPKVFLAEIKKWNAPAIAQDNPGVKLPDLPITVVRRADSSGTTFVFTKHLSAISPAWRDRGPGVGKLIQWPTNPMTARGNEDVAGRIKITAGSMGYVEYGYAQRAGLPMAWLENQAGNFIVPSPAHGQATLINSQDKMPPNLRMFLPDPGGQNSYPIVTYSWILLYGHYPPGPKGDLVKNFVTWGITEGQRYADNLGYCPLPDHIVTLVITAIGKIN